MLFTPIYIAMTFIKTWRIRSFRARLLEFLSGNTSVAFCKVPENAAETPTLSSKLCTNPKNAYLCDLLDYTNATRICSMKPMQCIEINDWVSCSGGLPLGCSDLSPMTDFDVEVLFECEMEPHEVSCHNITTLESIGLPIAWKAGSHLAIVLKTNIENLSAIGFNFVGGEFVIDHKLPVVRVQTVQLSGEPNKAIDPAMRSFRSEIQHSLKSMKEDFQWPVHAALLRKLSKVVDIKSEATNTTLEINGSTDGSLDTVNCIKKHITLADVSVSTGKSLTGEDDENSKPDQKFIDVENVRKTPEKSPEKKYLMEQKDNPEEIVLENVTVEIQHNITPKKSSLKLDLKKGTSQLSTSLLNISSQIKSVTTHKRVVSTKKPQPVMEVSPQIKEDMPKESSSQQSTPKSVKCTRPLVNTKSPNVLIYSDSIAARDNLEASLRKVLDCDRYTIYSVSRESLEGGAWRGRASLVAVAGCVGRCAPLLLAHLLDGGRLLALCSDLLHTVLPYYKTAEVRENEVVQFSYDKWKSVRMKHHIFCYQASPAKKQFSTESDRQPSKYTGHPGHELDIQVLASEETWRTPSLLQATDLTNNGIAIFSQIHLEADPSDYLGEDGAKSNEARLGIIHKVLGDILSLHVKDSQALNPIEFTKGFFLGNHVQKLSLMEQWCPSSEGKRVQQVGEHKIQWCLRGETPLEPPSERFMPVYVYECPEHFSTVEYFDNLTSRELGRVVIYSEVVTSTMSVVGAPLAHGVAAVARRQARALGRRGNAWLSPPGQAAISVQVSGSTPLHRERGGRAASARRGGRGAAAGPRARPPRQRLAVPARAGRHLPHGVAAVARRQARARGRRGNAWLSPPGQAAISVQVSGSTPLHRERGGRAASARRGGRGAAAGPRARPPRQRLAVPARAGRHLPHGVAAVARRQARARGRRGNAWLSPPGQAAISVQVSGSTPLHRERGGRAASARRGGRGAAAGPRARPPRQRLAVPARAGRHLRAAHGVAAVARRQARARGRRGNAWLSPPGQAAISVQVSGSTPLHRERGGRAASARRGGRGAAAGPRARPPRQRLAVPARAGRHLRAAHGVAAVARRQARARGRRGNAWLSPPGQAAISVQVSGSTPLHRERGGRAASARRGGRGAAAGPRARPPRQRLAVPARAGRHLRAAHGVAAVARRQARALGRRGNAWLSPPGQAAISVQVSGSTPLHRERGGRAASARRGGRGAAAGPRARAAAATPGSHGVAAVARRQARARGRRGNAWLSPPGQAAISVQVSGSTPLHRERGGRAASARRGGRGAAAGPRARPPRQRLAVPARAGRHLRAAHGVAAVARRQARARGRRGNAWLSPPGQAAISVQVSGSTPLHRERGGRAASARRGGRGAAAGPRARPPRQRLAVPARAGRHLRAAHGVAAVARRQARARGRRGNAWLSPPGQAAISVQVSGSTPLHRERGGRAASARRGGRGAAAGPRARPPRQRLAVPARAGRHLRAAHGVAAVARRQARARGRRGNAWLSPPGQAAISVQVSGSTPLHRERGGRAASARRGGRGAAAGPRARPPRQRLARTAWRPWRGGRPARAAAAATPGCPPPGQAAISVQVSGSTPLHRERGGRAASARRGGRGAAAGPRARPPRQRLAVPARAGRHLPHGVAAVARRQARARGRRGNAWLSPPGQAAISVQVSGSTPLHRERGGRAASARRGGRGAAAGPRARPPRQRLAVPARAGRHLRAAHGVAAVARRQARALGRRGNAWLSPPGQAAISVQVSGSTPLHRERGGRAASARRGGRGAAAGPRARPPRQRLAVPARAGRHLRAAHGVAAVARRQARALGRRGNAWLSPPGQAAISVQVSGSTPLHRERGGRAASARRGGRGAAAGPRARPPRQRLAVPARAGRHLRADMAENIANAASDQHAAALAAVRAIRSIPTYEHLDLRIKWPNDIYFGRDVKIGGTMTLANCMKDDVIVTVGTGVNITNSIPTVCVNDIIAEYNRKHGGNLAPISVERFLARYCSELERSLDYISTEGGVQAFLEQYYQYWLHSGEEIRVQKHGGSTPVEGVILGVDDAGWLVVRTPAGDLQLEPDGNTFDIMAGLIAPKC
ncbi:hypothetical protein ACJJTC_004722 [Scirpophaga incertulas]